MENEDHPFARFLGFYREGYEAYVRFMCEFYGGEPRAKADDLNYRIPLSWLDEQETTP
nr:hypothetical protein GA0070560_104329 [uncultured bacterium]